MHLILILDSSFLTKLTGLITLLVELEIFHLVVRIDAVMLEASLACDYLDSEYLLFHYRKWIIIWKFINPISYQ
jgi:hypothetical protein